MPAVPSTWGPVLREGVGLKELAVVPYDVQLDYEYWSYCETLLYPVSQTMSHVMQSLIRVSVDIMSSIIPEDMHDEIPVGFNTAGHVGEFSIIRARTLSCKLTSPARQRI